ncbi:maternal protein exuperantia isoform X1 [Culex quinquefasciatus]|uniref:maternal protein exuperantia isoform X1 n=1 Tax=Culex quinquefasciatus TaxID=7176 RepID=UPI0018E38B56|nr:maternal protein exuperantia isoform X1 [Culex quinquefasciatus]
MVSAGLDESKVDFEHLEEEECGSDDSDSAGVPAGTLSSKFDRTDTSINTHPLPHGRYTLIGIDIDTTGRRLIDEIVQISAYTPEHQHSQYIMPLMNLNPAARQRHQVRVITVGFFRMLKSMQTYRVVKTKTEVSALNEFITWLEERLREDEGSDGVVLIYHEQRKFVPYMVIEALKKYALLDRFTATVKSFANGFKLAEQKCTKTIKYFSIRQLADLVIGEDEAKGGFEGNAAYRARLAYQLARKLANDGATPLHSTDLTAPETDDGNKSDTTTEADTESGAENPKPQRKSCASSVDENNNEVVASSTVTTSDDEQTSQQQQQDQSTVLDSSVTVEVDDVTGQLTTVPEPQPRSRPTTEAEREQMCTVLCELASPISCEIGELDEQEKILLRQNSLRPVFLQYFKTTIYHRVKAVTYRRVLAEYGHDFESLRQIWTESKREGLEQVIAKLTELKEDERTELCELLDCHYDPDKQQLKPVVKRVRRRTSRGRLFFANKNSNTNNNNSFANNSNVSNKENRKPNGGPGGRNNNNANQKNFNQQQQQQPSSPTGNKKFRQRQPRRRRNNNNNNNTMDKQNDPNFNQPPIIQASA